MITASMATHTPVTDYLDMTIPAFLRIFVALCNVMEKKRRREE